MWRLMQCGYFLCFSLLLLLLLLFRCLWYFLPFYCEISVKYSLLHSVCFLWRRLWNRINICATVSGPQCFWNPAFVYPFSIFCSCQQKTFNNFKLYFIFYYMPNRFVNIDKLLFSWIHSFLHCICNMENIVLHWMFFGFLHMWSFYTLSKYISFNIPTQCPLMWMFQWPYCPTDAFNSLKSCFLSLTAVIYLPVLFVFLPLPVSWIFKPIMDHLNIYFFKSPYRCVVLFYGYIIYLFWGLGGLHHFEFIKCSFYSGIPKHGLDQHLL